MEKRELVTFEELKKYLKINRSTLYKFVQSGKIPSLKVGKQWRFDLKEIDNWLSEQNLAYKNNGHKQAERLIQEKEQDRATGTIEKRNFFRLEKNFPVRFSLGNEEEIFQATGRNISEGGIFIESEGLKKEVLSGNNRVKLLIEFPEQAKPAEVISEVAWFSEEPFSVNRTRIGLKFADLLDETRLKISSYILKYSQHLNDIPKIPLAFPIRLESSIVVKRNQEEVFNFLKDMGRFSEFIEGVRSVKVINEEENKIISEWEVDIDGLSLKWRQLDVLDPKKNFIRFKMLQGDFESYTGQWSLQQLLTGTELKLTMVVDWGLPNLTRYAEPELKKKIDDHIQDTLMGLKKAFWSNNTSKLVKFACIIHTTEIELFGQAIDEPGLKYKNRNLLEKTFEWTAPFKCSNITGLHSKTSKKIDGELMMCTLLPEQILDPENKMVLSRVIEAAKMAENNGARIIGLGAYVAGVGKKGILVQRALNIPVTTGTNYTIAITMDGVIEAARRIGIDLDSANVAIVGATGSIGRICAQILSTQVDHLVLVARNEVRLNELASLLQPSGKAKISISTEIDKIVPLCDIIITVTNSPHALIDAQMFKPGSVVCDISLPKNVSEEDALKRKDILVIDGGLVKLPGNVDFHFYYGLPPRLTYACMAETMILAMEEKFESYSLGGNVSLEKVKEISRLGKKHGFELANLRSFGRIVSEERINKVRDVYLERKGIKK